MTLDDRVLRVDLDASACFSSEVCELLDDGIDRVKIPL